MQKKLDTVLDLCPEIPRSKRKHNFSPRLGSVYSFAPVLSPHSPPHPNTKPAKSVPIPNLTNQSPICNFLLNICQVNFV